MKKLFTLCLICFVGIQLGIAQEGKKLDNIEVTESKATFLGKSAKISDLIEGSLTSKEKIAKYKMDKKKPVNFRNRLEHPRVVPYPELEHQGPDPVLQPVLRSASGEIEPLVNRDGLTSSGDSPLDPTGAIGLDFYVQAVNVTDVGVYDKEGTLVQQFPMQTLWSEFNAGSAGDPIVLFDQEVNKWIITEFTDPRNLLIAVSETSDPLGSYNAYSFLTPNFPDYPKYAIWGDYIYVTTNEEGSGVMHQYFFDKNALYAGSNDATFQRVQINGTTGSEQGFVTSTPVNWEGTTRPADSRPIVLKLNDSSWGGSAVDAVDVHLFDINFDDPTLTTVELISVPTAPYDAFPCNAGGFGFACIEQAGGDGLDAVPEVIYNVPHYRNFGTHESMVFCFVTDITAGQDVAGVRWVELRKDEVSNWAVYQEGTYSQDDGLERFLASCSIDKSGNIGLAYSVSSESTNAGIRFTGRRVSDPLGMMTFPECVAVEGQSALNYGGRFADYAHMSIDPVNESTFWFTGEYAGNNGQTRTRIVSFEIGRDSFDLSLASIVSPSSGGLLTNAETVEVTVANVGVEPMSNFEIGFSLDGEEQESMTINETLASGESANYTFGTTIDLSTVGDYLLSAYVADLTDTNDRNDSLEKQVTNSPANNASLALDAPLNVCASDINFEYTITNSGAAPLTSLDISVFLNGELVETFTWSGNLEQFDDTIESYSIPGVEAGDYEVTVELSNPNGSTDFDLDDNSLSSNVGIQSEEGRVVFNITTDLYPGEVTWELTEIGGGLAALGGPYEGYFEQITASEEFCLDPDKCYTFEIFDEYGDGICCGYGEGFYNIVDFQGDIIIASDGQYGDSESNDFCLDMIDCMLDATVDVLNAVNDDLGSIMVTASNGVEPYIYSIDGTNFQVSGIFDNLTADTYEVSVQDADGCAVSTVVTIESVSSSTTDLGKDPIIAKITPNPNEGFFELTIDNYPGSEYVLRFDIVDNLGKIVQTLKIPKYGDRFTAEVSLVAYPSGIYYIRFPDSELTKLIRIVKI